MLDGRRLSLMIRYVVLLYIYIYMAVLEIRGSIQQRQEESTGLIQE